MNEKNIKKIKENEKVSEQNEKDLEKKRKKEIRKSRFKIILFNVLISIILTSFFVFFALFWQKSKTKLAICNAFYFSAFFLFVIGWFILMYNKNIFSIFIYGTKQLGLMFVGKRPKKSYLEYQEDITNNPVSKIYFMIPFLTAIPNLIIAIIINITL